MGERIAARRSEEFVNEALAGCQSEATIKLVSDEVVNVKSES